MDQTFLSARDELARFDHQAFTAVAGKGLPPCDCVIDSALVTERDRAPLRRGYDLIGGDRHPVGYAHVPDVVLIEPDAPFTREKMEARP